MDNLVEQLPMPQPQLPKETKLTSEEIQVTKAFIKATFNEFLSQKIIANNHEFIERWTGLSEKAKELVISEFVRATVISKTGRILNSTDTSELFTEREKEWEAIANQINPQIKNSLSDPALATGLEAVFLARNWLAKACREEIQPNLWRALADYAVAESQIGNRLGKDCCQAWQFLTQPTNSPGSPLEEIILTVRSSQQKL